MTALGTALGRRRIGRTALEVTEIGLGTATLGGSRVEMTDAARGAIVRAAWDAGIRYFDTAPFYGVGAADLGR
jgi:D-threo-aldose 1-dehydrogenase